MLAHRAPEKSREAAYEAERFTYEHCVDSTPNDRENGCAQDNVL